MFTIGSAVFFSSSKKQPVVALSSCEAEYIAAASCACHAIWLRNLLRETNHPQHEPTQIYINNMSAIALAKNPVTHGRSKHIDRKYHFIRQHVKENNIQLVFCRTEDQIADIFTKPLKVETFEYFRIRLGLRNLN